MGFYDPPEPTPKESFIEDYCIRFEESDGCVERVRKANPTLNDDDFWCEVWDVAQEEAEDAWEEIQRDFAEAQAPELLS